MHTIRIRRGLVALATVLGLFAFATASPASAGTPADITGTIIVGANTFNVGGDPENPNCPGSTDLDVSFTGSATSGSWTASGTMKAPFQVTGSAAWFQAEITISGSGTYLPFDGSIIASMDLQSLDKDGPDDDITTTEDNCSKATLCNAVTQLIVDGSSSHTGSLPTPATGDVTNLIADSANGGVPMTLLGNCGVTLASALGGQDVFADLTLTW